ncbi:MAG: ammonium transporter [Armatimonadota bacterium]|nr:ammonium transporter [Armatimonadota bacterium]
MHRRLWPRLALCALAFFGPSQTAFAQTPAPKIDSGDTAWMMISAALVLLMTPGLAFFYGGLVRGKNVLSVLMQSFVACGLVSVAWVLVGYSLAFGPDHGGVIGDFSWAGLNGVSTWTANEHYAATIPHLLFMVYQMMFAIITPALISGAIVERMKFSAYFLFLLLWSLCVYTPLAHMIWGWHGFLGMSGPVKALDFAGGTVVETASGVSALVMALLLGRRRSNGPEDLRPHNLPLTMVGMGLLWFGWFGFNAGSAGSAGPLAVSAFVATQIAGATAALAWILIEWVRYKKPSTLGFASGALAGMVAITPAAGYVRPMPALLIGLVAAFVSFGAIKVKNKYGYDDSLDVFAVHGCAGIWGLLATGLFATISVNPAAADGLFNGNPAQLGRQAVAALVAIGVAGAGTFIVAKVVALLTRGLRASEEDEENGLDVTEHGEVGYADENSGSPLAGLG